MPRAPKTGLQGACSTASTVTGPPPGHRRLSCCCRHGSGYRCCCRDDDDAAADAAACHSRRRHRRSPVRFREDRASCTPFWNAPCEHALDIRPRTPRSKPSSRKAGVSSHSLTFRFANSLFQRASVERSGSDCRARPSASPGACRDSNAARWTPLAPELVVEGLARHPERLDRRPDVSAGGAPSRIRLGE